ncbi:unnamed protein product [Caenorhabditis nigoni]
MAITVSELLNGVASRLVYEGSPCDSHPCWNEGKCILNGSSSYHCECPPAFIGPQCEYRLFEICRSIRCRSSTSPICQVGSFFANCSFVNQQDFLSSCISTHCLNNGTCSNTTGSYRCICPPTFHGPFCQFDVNATNYSWSALEIALLFFVVFMIAFAVFIVCCASSNRMGFYISVPNKHYNRWAEEDDMFDDLPTENGEQLMAMADIRKGIVVSRTRETVLEDLEDSAILQL